MNNRDFNEVDMTNRQRYMEAMNDVTQLYESDGRAPTETWFDTSFGSRDGYGNDLPAKQKWSRLARHQRGHRWPDAQPRINIADRGRVVRTVGSQCEISDVAMREAISINETIDFRFGPLYPQEIMILGMMLYVTPERRQLCTEERFRTFIDEWDTSVERVQLAHDLLAERMADQ